MGRKPPKSGISTADVMTTVLQNWVEDEEKREQQEESEVDQLIEQQVRQTKRLMCEDTERINIQRGFYSYTSLTTTHLIILNHTKTDPV